MNPLNEWYGKTELLTGKPFFGNTRSILKSPVNFLGDLPKKYGPLVIANFAGKKYFILQHPEYIKHVLLDHHKAYCKPGATKILSHFLGEGLITSNGESWYKKRRLLQPAFHKQRLDHLLTIINEETTSFIHKLNALPASTGINISHELLRLNIAIIGRAMFGSALKEEMDTMVHVLESLTNYASTWMKSIIKIPSHWPTPGNRRFNNNCKIFDGIIYQLIDRRRKYRANPALTAHGDMLDMLLDYVDETTMDQMSEKQLRDEVTTVFMAGHETTAQTLSWIFYQLASEKAISQKVRHEAAIVLGDGLPTLDNLSQLIFTKQVIQEGMRCYPAVAALVRKPYADDEINGVKIPASSNVLINIYGMHHHPGYWNSPGIFDPEHFNAQSDHQRAPFAYLPFGGGPRLCIGSNFALMVMQVVVSRLSHCFQFDVPDGYIPMMEPNITIRAKDGIQLVVRKSLV